MTTGLPTSSGVQAVPTPEPIRCATEVACGMAGCCSWCPFSFTQCDWSAFTRVKTDNKDHPERLRTRTPSIMHFWQSPRERHQLECGEAKTRLTGGGHLILTLTTGTCLRWLHRIGARKKDAVLVWDGGVKSRAHGEATRRCYLNLWGSSGHSSAAWVLYFTKPGRHVYPIFVSLVELQASTSKFLRGRVILSRPRRPRAVRRSVC